MSITLTEKLEHYVGTLNTEGWNLAIREAFQRKTHSPELLRQLREECLAHPINNKEDYLAFCQKVLALILLYHRSLYSSELMSEDLSPLYLRLIRHQYPKEHQLATFYRGLIAFFLNQEIETIDLHEMDYGVVFREYGGHYPEDHLPHFIKSGELSLIAIVFSLLTKNEILLKKAIKVSHWLATFLQESPMFPEGIWMKEQEFCLASLSFVNALVFQYSRVMLPSLRIDKAYQAIQKVFTELTPEALASLGVLYPLLYLFLLEKLDKHSLPSIDGTQLKELKQDNSYLGYGDYHHKDFSCYCSASGVGSGFACFRRGSIQIVSVGPHFSSLGDMQKYGIYRTPMMKQTPFKDIMIEKQEKSFSFEGWTRVIDEESAVFKPGDSWLYMNVEAKESLCHLRVKWINLHHSPEVFLAFFVKAHKVIIDKNYHLHPHTLDRYQGKAAEIIFQNQNSSLTIKVENTPFMQVIPLAGETHFWGAQFLVAYSLPKDQEIPFEII